MTINPHKRTELSTGNQFFQFKRLTISAHFQMRQQRDEKGGGKGHNDKKISKSLQQFS